jgi:hypothetical protein
VNAGESVFRTEYQMRNYHIAKEKNKPYGAGFQPLASTIRNIPALCAGLVCRRAVGA